MFDFLFAFSLPANQDDKNKILVNGKSMQRCVQDLAVADRAPSKFNSIMKFGGSVNLMSEQS